MLNAALQPLLQILQVLQLNSFAKRNIFGFFKLARRTKLFFNNFKCGKVRETTVGKNIYCLKFQSQQWVI